MLDDDEVEITTATCASTAIAGLQLVCLDRLMSQRFLFDQDGESLVSKVVPLFLLQAQVMAANVCPEQPLTVCFEAYSAQKPLTCVLGFR